MAKTLTARSIEQLKADPVRRREVPDGLLTGLYFIVQPTGARSWAVRYRAGGKPRKLTLGPYPALGLGEAREAAREALQAVARGDDPAATKQARRRADGLDDRDLVASVVAEFIQRSVRPRLRTAAEIERMFERYVEPVWGERPIGVIGRKDVIRLLDELTDRGLAQGANRVFATIRRFFNWCLSRGLIGSNPCAGVRPPAEEVSRDRILTEDEIRWFWAACDSVGHPFGPVGKLLLLMGQRLAEIAEATWSEIDLEKRLLTLSRERTKNGLRHEVPLSDAAATIIALLPRIAGKRGLLFTTTGETPVSGFSRAKRNLDAAMLKAAREEAGDGVEILPWRLHDLRRSAASGMARLGINLPVIEKVLNHTSGSFAGIVGVYQRHSFAEEKRAALQTWANFVMSLIEGRTGNVVELRRVGGA